jgi:hypothetical protein
MFNGILIVESVSACSPNNTITKTTTGDEDTECLFNLYKLPVERLEQYFEANDIEDEKKMAIFVSVIGPCAYGILRNLV